MECRVRRELPSDVDNVDRLERACFPTPVEARLTALLRASPSLIVSLVAEAEQQIIGHVIFSQVTANDGSCGAGLAPLAVAETHRRQGIAAQLVRDGLETCRELGWGWAVVLGEPAYYQRFGFQPAAMFGLTDDYGGGDAFQVMELTPGQLPRGAGLVRYASEFASLEDDV